MRAESAARQSVSRRTLARPIRTADTLMVAKATALARRDVCGDVNHPSRPPNTAASNAKAPVCMAPDDDAVAAKAPAIQHTTAWMRSGTLNASRACGAVRYRRIVTTIMATRRTRPRC